MHGDQVHYWAPREGRECAVQDPVSPVHRDAGQELCGEGEDLVEAGDQSDQAPLPCARGAPRFPVSLCHHNSDTQRAWGGKQNNQVNSQQDAMI